MKIVNSNKYIAYSGALFLLFAICYLLATPAFAQGIQFPIAELGNCASKEECKAYCDSDEHKESCLNFAESNGLMKREEVEKARKFMSQTGPGGCRGEECRDYCESPANHNECMRFAVEQGFISQMDAERMRKFKAVAEEGGPGGCRGETCKNYCEAEEHREECFNFARERGLVDERQVEQFEKSRGIMEAIKREGGPGGCKNERECRNFCNDRANFRACAAFGAKAAGLSEEEVREHIEGFENEDRGFDKNRQEFESRIKMEREKFDERRKEFEVKYRERMMKNGQESREEMRYEYRPGEEESYRREFRQEDRPEGFREGPPPEEFQNFQHQTEFQRTPENFQNLEQPQFAPAPEPAPSPEPASEPAPVPTSRRISPQLLSNPFPAFQRLLGR